jgi:HSP20 family protein
MTKKRWAGEKAQDRNNVLYITPPKTERGRRRRVKRGSNVTTTQHKTCKAGLERRRKMNDWTVWNELERMRSEMDRLFGQSGGVRPWRLAFLPGTAARRYPLLNVGETDGGYQVTALAPGVEPQSFEVTVKDNVLTVSGEKRRTEGVKPEEYHRSERAVGKFVRSLELPAAIDPDRVKASYANGLLTVRLEKSEAAKPRQITVDLS